MPRPFAIKSVGTVGSSSLTYAPDRFQSKIAFFFREGDQRFKPVRMVINHKRYPTLTALLYELNKRIPLVRGVRAIYSPRGRQPIDDVDDIVNDGRYVCSSSLARAHAVDVDHMLSEPIPWHNNGPVLTFVEEDSRFIRTGLPAFDPSDDEEDHEIEPSGVKGRLTRLQESRNFEVKRNLERKRQFEFNRRKTPSWADRIRRIIVMRNGFPDTIKQYTLAVSTAYNLSKVKADLSEIFSAPVEMIFTLNGTLIRSVEEMFECGDLAFVASFGENFKPHPGYAYAQNGNMPFKLPPISRHQIGSPMSSLIARQRTKVLTPNHHRSDDVFDRPVVSPSFSGISSRHGGRIRPVNRSRSDDGGSIVGSSEDERRRASILKPLRTELRPSRRGRLADPLNPGRRRKRNDARSEIVDAKRRDSRGEDDTSFSVIQSWPNLVRGDEYLLPPREAARRRREEKYEDDDEDELPRTNRTNNTNNRRKTPVVPATDRSIRNRREVQHNIEDQTWAIKLVSGSMPSGTSSSHVTLTAYGHRGSSQPIILIARKKYFISNTSETFKAKMPNIGDIYKIRLETSNTGPNPDWICEEVMMENEETNEHLQFPCRKWFSEKEADKLIIRELAAYSDSRPAVSICQYEVIVQTGELWNGGTSGTVSITIFGERGDTGVRTLSKPLNPVPSKPFLKGQVDAFQLETVSLGEIRRIRLTHEPTSNGMGWYCENVIIRDLILNIDYLFPVNRWLSVHEEDRELSAEVRASDALSHIKIQDRQVWPYVKWMFTKPDNDLIIYSSVSHKALRITPGGFIDARSESIDRIAVFRCRPSQDALEGVFAFATTSPKNSVFLSFSQSKIVSKLQYGTGCDVRIHALPSREFVLESDKYPSNYISVAPNGQLYPETHIVQSPGPSQSFFCYVKGCFRNNGVIMLCTSLLQTLCIDRDPSMLTANGKRNRLAQFRVHKVTNGVRMFECLIFPGTYLQMKKGQCNCEGTGDRYCEFKVRKCREQGFVTLECARERGYLGFSPNGFVQVFFDTISTSPHCRIWPEVIEYGQKKPSIGKKVPAAGAAEPNATRRDSYNEEKHTGSDPDDDLNSDVDDLYRRRYRSKPDKNKPGTDKADKDPNKKSPPSKNKESHANKNERDKVEPKSNNKKAEKNSKQDHPPPVDKGQTKAKSKAPGAEKPKSESKGSSKKASTDAKKTEASKKAEPPPKEAADASSKKAEPKQTEAAKKPEQKQKPAEPSKKADEARAKEKESPKKAEPAAKPTEPPESPKEEVLKPASRPLAPTIVPIPNFHEQVDVDALQKLLASPKHDEDTSDTAEILIDILTARSAEQRGEIKASYKKAATKDLDLAIASVISGNLYNVFAALLIGASHSPTDFAVAQLNKILTVKPKDLEAIVDFICTAPHDELVKIKGEYQKAYGHPLEKDITHIADKGDDDYPERLLAMLLQRPASPASIDLKQVKSEVKKLNDSVRENSKTKGKFEMSMAALLSKQGHHFLRQVFDMYKADFKKDISDIIKSETNDETQKVLLAAVEAIRNKEEYFARRFREVTVENTDDVALIRLLVGRCEIDLDDIKKDYERLYRETLDKSVSKETSGDYSKALIEIVHGNKGKQQREHAKQLLKNEHKNEDHHDNDSTGDNDNDHKPAVEKEPEIVAVQSRVLAPTLVTAPNFNAKQDGEKIKQALAAKTVDETAINNIMAHRSSQQRGEIEKSFKQVYSKELAKELEIGLKKSNQQYKDALLALLKQPADRAASDLKRAFDNNPLKNKDAMSCLVHTILTSTLAELKLIKDAYTKLTKRDLKQDLTSDKVGFIGNVLASYLNRPASSTPPHVEATQAKEDAEKINKDTVVEKKEHSEETFVSLFSTRGKTQMRCVFEMYKRTYKKDIEEVIKSNYNGNVESGLLLVVDAIKSEPAFSAHLLNATSDQGEISRIVVSRCEIDLGAVRTEFEKAYKKPLVKDVEAKIKSDSLRKLLTEIIGHQAPAAASSQEPQKQETKQQDPPKPVTVQLRKDPINTPTVKPIPNFNVEKDCEGLRKAIMKEDADEAGVVVILAKRSWQQRAEIETKYKEMYDEDLEQTLLAAEVEDKFCNLMMDLLKLPMELSAVELKRSFDEDDGDKDDKPQLYENIVEIICSESSHDNLKQLKEQYKKLYDDVEIEDTINEKVPDGFLRRFFISALNRPVIAEKEEEILPKAKKDAEKLHKAVNGMTAEEDCRMLIIELFTRRTPVHLRAIFDYYVTDYVDTRGGVEAVVPELFGDDEYAQRVLLDYILMIRNKPAYFGKRMEAAISTSNHAWFSRVLVSRCELDLANVKIEYNRLFGRALAKDIETKTDGDYRQALTALVTGNYF